MKPSFVFDVDGTLTPSRGNMNIDFHLWFSDFCYNHDVYLVTGSDKKRTQEQVTEYVYAKCKAVYQCSGNEMWKGDKLIHSSDMAIPSEMYDMFSVLLSVSQFENRTGNHFEVRSGQANFSVVGRGTTPDQRKSYIEWDEKTNERHEFANILNLAFGDKFEFTVGGETGIDVTEKGKGKEQILLDFPDQDVIFFGDKIMPDGNDYSLAQALMYHTDASQAYRVDDWRHTWELLVRMV